MTHYTLVAKLQATGLEHPNIVSLFGYIMAEDEVILIMNFVDGSNLDRMLFGKKEYREVSEVNSPQKLGHVTSDNWDM